MAINQLDKVTRYVKIPWQNSTTFANKLYKPFKQSKRARKAGAAILAIPLIAGKVACEIATQKVERFVLSLENPQNRDIKISWWVVN